jgi:hypothetical protein
MTDTLEPPQTVDPSKVQPLSESTSFSERMAEARAAASQEAGRHPESETEEEREVNDQREQRTQSRQAASKPQNGSKPKNEVQTQQKPNVEQKKPVPETKVETNPFDVLNKLKTEGLGEEKTDDGPPPPPGSTPQAVQTWKQMEAARKQAEAEAKTHREALEVIKKELETAKQVGTPEEVKALKDELAQMRNELAQSDVRKSKDYIETVSGPISTILNELKATSQKWNIPWNQMVDAMETGERDERNYAISKILSEAHKKGKTENDEPQMMDEVSKLEVVSAINEFIQRDQYGAKLLADADKVKEALTQKEKQAQQEKQAQTQQQFSKVTDMVMDRMAEAIPQLKDDPEFAKLVKESVSLKEEPLHIRAMKDIWMASAERVLNDHKKQHEADKAEIEELKKQITQLSEASPEVDSSDGGGNGKAEKDDRPLSEKVAELRRKQGQ